MFLDLTGRNKKKIVTADDNAVYWADKLWNEEVSRISKGEDDFSGVGMEENVNSRKLLKFSE